MTSVRPGGSRRASRAVMAAGSVVFAWHALPFAMAQASPDPSDACAAVTAATERLACYDRTATQKRAAAHSDAGLSGKQVASVASPSGADATGKAAAPTATTDDTTGLDARQIEHRRRKQGLPPEVTKTVVSRVAHLDLRPTRHYAFELDNGQVWVSTNAEPALSFTPHETVRIAPGFLGAFFLSTEEGSTMRVYRQR